MPSIIHEEARDFAKINKGTGAIINPPKVAEGFHGKFLNVNGKNVIDFTRLDYLSVGSSRQVRQIMAKSLMQNNRSCPSSQKIMKTAQNVALEDALSDLHGMKKSLVFLAGYATNVNIMEAIGLRTNTSYISKPCRRTGLGKMTKKMPTNFFMDGDSHFSLQHGASLAKAQSEKNVFTYHFPTMNYDKLEKLLKNSLAKHGDEALRLIVSDTLASSTGVILDVERLCQIAEQYKCLLYLDEAHAVGAIGIQGSGIAKSCASYEQNKHRIILMGTLTKTFSQIGGYACVIDEELAEFLELLCPQYIFSAPVPPWMAEASVEIISFVRGPWGDQERRKLNEVSSYMRKELIDREFDIMGSSSHIIPVHIGDDMIATAMANFFEENGYIISCFRHPAVSSALLRFSVCSDVIKDEVDDVVRLLEIARKRFFPSK